MILALYLYSYNFICFTVYVFEKCLYIIMIIIFLYVVLKLEL